MKDGKAGKTPNEDIMAANRTSHLLIPNYLRTDCQLLAGFYSSLYLNGIDE